jgi:PKHD-type hydroxylase
MLVVIPDLLPPDEVAKFREALETAHWTDGRITAGTLSGLVKRNAQVAPGCPVGAALGDRLLDALGRSPLFVSAALPARTFPPLFNRYGPGQDFGLHVDNAIRPVPGQPVKVRTDLSCTVFLADPDSYDGGELEIETAFGAQAVKLPAGSAVLYPGSSLHRVTPVTRGVRLASFFWVQSMVRLDADRSVLFDLDQAIQAEASRAGQADPLTVRLTGVYHNLIRRFAET